MKSDVINKEKIIYVLSCVFIVIVCVYDIRRLDYIAVLNDEFGYWGNATAFLGYEWKELISETPYYAWGYSFWLIPIIALFSSSIVWYKLAIGLNIIFLLLSYCLCVKIGNRIFSEIDRKVIAIVSLSVILYPSNILYSQSAWSESLLYFLTWLGTYILLLLEEKFSYKLFLSEVLLLTYMYIVHARTMGIIGVGMIILCLILIKHNKKVYGIISFILIFMLGYIINMKIKNIQLIELWSNSKISDMNNVGLNGKTFESYFFRVWGDLRLLFESLGAKLIVLFVSTGFTLPVAIYTIIIKSIQNIKKKNIFDNYIITKLWCIGIILAMWFLCSLQMMYWGERKDIIVYSRYMENALGPVLFLGTLFVITGIEGMAKVMISSIVIFLSGINSVYFRVANAAGAFNTICSPIFGAFYEGMQNVANAFIGIVILSFFMIIVILSLQKINSKKLRTLIFSMVFIVVFTILNINAKSYLLDWRSNLDRGIVTVKEEIEKLGNNKELYYVKNIEHDQYSANPKYLQYMLPDCTIHIIEKKDIQELEEDNILILLNSKDTLTNEELTGKLDKVVSTEMLIVYQK